MKLIVPRINTGIDPLDMTSHRIRLVGQITCWTASSNIIDSFQTDGNSNRIERGMEHKYEREDLTCWPFSSKKDETDFFFRFLWRFLPVTCQKTVGFFPPLMFVFIIISYYFLIYDLFFTFFLKMLIIRGLLLCRFRRVDALYLMYYYVYSDAKARIWFTVG